jgi:hypothetical protein
MRVIHPYRCLLSREPTSHPACLIQKPDSSFDSLRIRREPRAKKVAISERRDRADRKTLVKAEAGAEVLQLIENTEVGKRLTEQGTMVTFGTLDG